MDSGLLQGAETDTSGAVGSGQLHRGSNADAVAQQQDPDQQTQAVAGDQTDFKRQMPAKWLTMPNPQDHTLHLCTMDLDVLQDLELANLLARAESLDSITAKLQLSVENWVGNQLRGLDCALEQELHWDLLPLAADLLQQRLASGTDFHAVPYIGNPVQLVMQRITMQLEQVAAGLGTELLPATDGQSLRLPLLRLTFKSHKVPAAWRFITTACGTVLDRLNSIVASISKLLLDAMAADAESRAGGLLRWYGVAAHAYTVIEGAQQVVINLPEVIDPDFTADVTKCFENIPTDTADPVGVPAILTKVLALAFSMQRQGTEGRDPRLALHLAGGTAANVQWVNRPGHSSHKVYLTQAQALHLMCTTVSSAYVLNGDGLFQQTRGIPMGAAYSPALCNIYLLWWERAALLRQCNLITQRGYKLQVLREWQYFFRYIDDLCTLNGSNIATWAQHPTNQDNPNGYTWVYPSCLGIDVTNRLFSSWCCSNIRMRLDLVAEGMVWHSISINRSLVSNSNDSSKSHTAAAAAAAKAMAVVAAAPAAAPAAAASIATTSIMSQFSSSRHMAAARAGSSFGNSSYGRSSGGRAAAGQQQRQQQRRQQQQRQQRSSKNSHNSSNNSNSSRSRLSSNSSSRSHIINSSKMATAKWRQQQPWQHRWQHSSGSDHKTQQQHSAAAVASAIAIIAAVVASMSRNRLYGMALAAQGFQGPEALCMACSADTGAGASSLVEV
eukprot:gene15350-biopygen16079